MTSLTKTSAKIRSEVRRQTFHDVAFKAWAEYQATGMHVTMEEADKWLAELENGNDIEPPACHP